jgi:tetratricopeptide (TPR) repeat protein
MRRWWVILFGACAVLVGCAGRFGEELRPCEQAVEARDWQGIVDQCVGEEWSEFRELGQAGLAFERGDHDQAKAVLVSLLFTDADADASYLLGYLLGDTQDDDKERAGLNFFQRAYTKYRSDGRHSAASRAAGYASRITLTGAEFDGELGWATIALKEAELAGEPRARGKATLALAEVQDSYGMVQEALEGFDDAERELRAWPGEVALVHLNRAQLLLDLERYDAARKEVDLAIAENARETSAAFGARRSEFQVGARLNRAIALAHLERFEEADHELEALDRPDIRDSVSFDGENCFIKADDARATKIVLTYGLVAARKRDLGAARNWFECTNPAHVEDDYKWTVATELAGAYRGEGRFSEARAYYEKAIDIIEGMRGQADYVELRPWVLDRRKRPYVELLDMLAWEELYLDALVVAEALHARTLLDVVLSPAGSADAARNARLRATSPATQRLSANDLIRIIGTHEVLVFATVNDGFWRFHVANGRVTARYFDQAAAQTIEDYRNSLDEYGPQAAALLLPEDLTSSTEPLVVIGEEVWDTPFASLPRERGMLVDARPVAYLPGVAAMECRAGSWTAGGVALGDADGTLRGAAKEVEMLAASPSIRGYLGANATWAALVQAKHLERLHLAVHGRRREHAMALELADGDVTAAQILDAGIGPKQVVLAGCNTANDADAPESWSSFPSAFVAAGSRYVISTVQSVRDDAAATFVGAYYDLVEAMDPIRATREAQLRARGTSQTKDWASFTAWGSPACDSR